MFRNKKRNRWEATEPKHLIGWQIKEITKEVNSGMMKVIVARVVGGEVRDCWVSEDVVPLFVVERNWNNLE